MSRTYKDIRPEYRAGREREIVELRRARGVRRHARDRARDRQLAARELARKGAIVMLARVVWSIAA